MQNYAWSKKFLRVKMERKFQLDTSESVEVKELNVILYFKKKNIFLYS